MAFSWDAKFESCGHSIESSWTAGRLSAVSERTPVCNATTEYHFGISLRNITSEYHLAFKSSSVVSVALHCASHSCCAAISGQVSSAGISIVGSLARRLREITQSQYGCSCFSLSEPMPDGQNLHGGRDGDRSSMMNKRS